MPQSQKPKNSSLPTPMRPSRLIRPIKRLRRRVVAAVRWTGAAGRGLLFLGAIGGAFVHALRLQLRDQRDDAVLQRWLTAAEFEQTRSSLNPASTLMLHMGRDLGECVRQGQIEPCLAVPMDATLSSLTASAASCERIKNTPVPFSYTLLLHRTAYMYCFLLPFGLVDTTGFMTPFVVGIVAYTFFGLDALGDEIEEPFGLESNDLPLDTLCRAIEINLRESLGEKDLPPPLYPVNFQLT